MSAASRIGWIVPLLCLAILGLWLATRGRPPADVAANEGPETQTQQSAKGLGPQQDGSVEYEYRVAAPRQPLPSSGDRSTAPSPRQDQAEAVAEDGPAAWEQLYADATLGQIIDERRVLEQALFEDIQPYYDQAWSAGNFEVQPAEKNERGGYRIPHELLDGEDLLNVKLDAPSAEVRWVTLPRAEFAEQYRARDKIKWLLERETALRQMPPVSPRK